MATWVFWLCLVVVAAAVLYVAWHLRRVRFDFRNGDRRSGRDRRRRQS